MNAEKILNEKKWMGWSVKGLYLWLTTIYKGVTNKNLPLSKRLWCLNRGFSPSSMLLYGENELKNHYKEYLSEKQYYKMHPINGTYTLWIDDKMTTKYCFSKYNEYFPKYYFEIQDGKILRLSDCKKEYASTVGGILECLDDEKLLAVKRMAGSGGVGFYRLEQLNGGYLISGKRVSRDDIIKLFSNLDEYLIMELIENHQSIRKVWPDALNTMRMLWANVDGKFILMRSFLRFGNSMSNGVDNARMGGIETIIDEETGKILYTMQQNEKGLLVKISCHPDTNEPF